MKIENYLKTFKLTGSNIDAFSERIEKALELIKMERQNRLRIRLSTEEALLRMRDHFGEDVEVDASISKRFGRLMIRVDLEDEQYNPLSEEETDLEDICGTLLTAMGLSPQYQYDGKINSFRILLPVPGMSPIIEILIAILGGVLLGLIGKLLFKGDLPVALTDNIIDPSFTLWYRVLNVMSGPVIFFAIITTILNSGKLSLRGGDYRMIILRYFILSFIAADLAMVAAAFAYPLAHRQIGLSVNESIELIPKLFKIVPEDFFSPFITSNTPQLLIMAVVLGMALNVLSTQTVNLTRIIKQANTLGLQLAEWISRIVPYVTLIFIGFEVWMDRIEILLGIWKCILIAFLVSLVYMALMLIIVSAKEKIRAKVLVKKLWPSFWLTLKAGSLDAAYGQTEKSCAFDLGLKRSFTSISLPNGLVLYMPINAIGTIVFMTFAAMKFGVSTSPVWYLLAVVLSVVLFVATPPVPGANLLAYIALFKILGIPSNVLIDAMIFDIIFGFFANAGNQSVLQLELILQAERMGFLNKKILLKVRENK